MAFEHYHLNKWEFSLRLPTLLLSYPYLFKYQIKKSHSILSYLYFSVDVPQFCQANPTAIVRDEDNCAQYYNCSDKQSNLGNFLAECRYPDLFSDVYMNCRSFNTVSCDKRLEPQSPCKYVSLQKTNFECIK